MGLVNLKLIVSMRLVAQYGNFRIVDTPHGEIKIPAKYLMPILQLPPATIEIPELDYQFMIDYLNDILEMVPYHSDFIKLKNYMNRIDTTKLKIRETIPVPEVPVEYISLEDNRRHKVTNGGVEDLDDNEESLFRAILDDDDEDDEDDDSIRVEHVHRYVSPNFIYQRCNWQTMTDIQEFTFIDKNKRVPIPDDQKASASPIKQILKTVFGSK